eukprot:CCRYP_010429-RC/>CCRYP_010429-RC protein AED:0.08 eAED:0.08 QI:0/0.9/0.90/1/0.7/0.54/11/1348/1458
MNDPQLESLLTAIAISSGLLTAPSSSTPTQRNSAFQALDQFQSYPGRIAACLDLLTRPTLLLHHHHATPLPLDVTTPTKLYALGILQEFLKRGYAASSEEDRLRLRSSILGAARGLAEATEEEAQSRILSMKIAALVADLAVREFPQRWGTFVQDLVGEGGIWSSGGGAGVGVKICLECLKLITEDCTDSDFNSKASVELCMMERFFISTTRRNDILLGLNETSHLLLHPIFSLLSNQYSSLLQSKATLQQMNAYLASQSRTPAQMTAEERAQYQHQIEIRDRSGAMVADALTTLEKFCQSMPLDWMFTVQNGIDYVSALLHLLQEEVANIHVLAVACLYQLTMRKLESEHWWRLVGTLPGALYEASVAVGRRAEERGLPHAHCVEMLVEQLEFHRAVSRMGSTLVSAHVAYITSDKEVGCGSGAKFDAVSTFLRLLSEMATHHSGVVCGEQINTWVGLLRDPAIIKTKVLTPHLSNVLMAYMKHLVKIRWSDVWDESHPYAALIEESWDSEEDYDEWLGNLRSKASLLFRSISYAEPEISVTIVHSKIQSLLNAHSTGEPRDQINPQNNELTPKSTACLEFEGVTQPLDNILQGLPSWSVDDGNYDAKRMKIRQTIKPLLAELANMIVAWNPHDVWLKFRRTLLLEALKHYWKYDPSTLPNGIDSLLVYLSATDNPPRESLSVDVVGLRKKVGVSIVAVAKVVPHLLVPWLAQLSDRAKTLLTNGRLSPTNEMHLYEFLSCVATAVENAVDRSNFIMDVLANAVRTLESPEVQNAISSVDGLLSFMGIAQVASDPGCVTNPTFVDKVTSDFSAMFSSLNQFLSVGKRCHEAARARPNGGLPLQNLPLVIDESSSNFPDEGPVSLNELAINDPFVPLWPKLLPTLIRVLDVTLGVWHPDRQATLLCNNIQRYALAISDDEAYLATKQENTTGGVFGEGGTAGSIVSGWDRRDRNLTPKWSGWFNELRNNCFQLLGLLSAQRVLYAPEISHLYPQLVSVVANPEHIRSMEHRHLNQYLKQFIEIMMLSCPATLYQSHLTAILVPLFENMKYRLQCSWDPILRNAASSTDSTKPLTSESCTDAVNKLSTGNVESWLLAYYARGGLFVGDLDSVTGEAAVEKARVELTRNFSDMIQSVLALKGGWALVLANKAKEEQAVKKNDPSKLTSGPRNQISQVDGPVNADGTSRTPVQLHLDARRLLRIDKMCHFLLLENELIAGHLVVTIVQCLEYPDAYSCRRCTRICHRILETVAWVDRYTDLIGNRLLSAAVKNIVTEPKWMIGIEWDMINIIRDIYGRLTLGQYFLPGGQGAGMQQARDSNSARFEQSRVVDKPLQGGGILVAPSDLPRRIFMQIGISQEDILTLEKCLEEKRSAKEQKDILRDVLRVAADKLKESEGLFNRDDDNGLLGRANLNESLLHRHARQPEITALPEKLVTYSMVRKAEEKVVEADGPWHGNLFG